MEEMTASLEKLRVSSENPLPEPLDELLSLIHKQSDATEVCEDLVSGGLLPLVTGAIKSSNLESQAKGAELVAELAKIESCRLGCVQSGLVPTLVEKMSSPTSAVALQACRALGNICYENDGGRVSVMESGGAEQLLGLLKRAAELPNSPDDQQLRLVSTGFLLNLLNSYDTVQGESLLTELVDVLCQYLDKFNEDEDIPTHALLSLTCLADTEVGRELVISKDITPQLVRVLRKNESAEVTETALELITNIADTESVKTLITKGGVCEAIVEVVKRHQSNPNSDLSPPIIKTACDLLVLILVGDESMGIIYDKGSGTVYKELVEWLVNDNEDLQISGALAMGNFARCDAHCIQMVQSGISEKLLKILSSHNSGEGDIRLQHAVLSAFRNLSIPKENKQELLKQGVLDVLLPMTPAVETFPVVFKLLATLRMIVDGQSEAAIKVGNNNEVAKRLVTWCGTIDHPGVQGESTRLLAWTIKNCNGDAEVIKCLVSAGCIAPIVMMLASEHALMVNEAALALVLVFAKEVKKELVENTKLVDVLTAVLNNPNPYLPEEVLANIFSMMTALSADEPTFEMLKTEKLKAAVEKFSEHDNEQLKTLTTALKEKM